MDKKFSHSWLFNDECYNLLPLADRSLIIPISGMESKAIWKNIFAGKLSHLIDISPESGWQCIKKSHVDTDEYDAGVLVIDSYGITDADIVFF